MEQNDPWLDDAEVKHNNVKSIKPNKICENKETKKETNRETKEMQIAAIEKEKLPPGSKFVYISEQKPKCDNGFLETLLSHLDNEISENGKKFAAENFGKEWLSFFLKDVEDLKQDIMNSRFYVSQREMILLKYIFLLKQ